MVCAEAPRAGERFSPLTRIVGRGLLRRFAGAATRAFAARRAITPVAAGATLDARARAPAGGFATSTFVLILLFHDFFLRSERALLRALEPKDAAGQVALHFG
jgi:hypothetical protein